MKMSIRILISLIFVTLASGAVMAQTTGKCYANSGLKDAHEISFQVSGGKVNGEFRIDRDFDMARSETYTFAGTIKGATVLVKFLEGRTPDALPKLPTTKTWTIQKTADGDVLKVTLYGRNYNTGKSGNYAVNYKSCVSEYESLRKSATRVSFAKGAMSATYNVTLAAQTDRRSFLMNIGAGQSLSVLAPGCGIGFYYPNGRKYEEGTAIDTFAGEAMPQGGDYLFMISPAGEPGTCSVKFTAK